MTRLSRSLGDELQRLTGTTTPMAASVRGSGQTVLTVELESVEALSSLLISLTLDAPALQKASSDQLRKAAEDLSAGHIPARKHRPGGSRSTHESGARPIHDTDSKERHS